MLSFQKRERGGLLRLLTGIVLAAVVAGLVAAPFLVPLAAWAPDSLRADLTYEQLLGGSMNSSVFRLEGLAHVYFPSKYYSQASGHPADVALFVGGPLVVLAALGLQATWRRDRWFAALVGLLAVFALLVAARTQAFALLYYALPPARAFTSVTRILILVHFALVTCPQSLYQGLC